MPDPVVVALSTCPDEKTAREIAERLVTERLAACVNRVGGAKSTYFWDGGLQDDEEILLIIKTTQDRLPALRDRIKALHPYELPELIALGVAGGNEGYLDWVRQGVAAKGEHS
jgi:periplasmic divalent cation tolerance protein